MNGNLLLAQDAGKLDGKCVFAIFVGVVLEILFKLIEDHKQSSIDGHEARFEAVEKALVRGSAFIGFVTRKVGNFIFDGSIQAGDGVISPGAGSSKINEKIVGIVLE